MSLSLRRQSVQFTLPPKQAASTVLRLALLMLSTPLIPLTARSAVANGSARAGQCDAIFVGSIFGALQRQNRVDHWLERFIRRKDNDVLVTRHQPSEGPGTVWIIDFKFVGFPKTLPLVVLRYPGYFARFEISVDPENSRFDGVEGGGRVTVPDSVRLNWLRAQRGPLVFEYEDRPILKFRQPYTNREFFAGLLKRKISIAVHGETFVHDRLEEHLLGGLLLPDFIPEGLIESAQLMEKLGRLPWLQSAAAQSALFRLKDSLGKTWDLTTGRMGSNASRELTPYEDVGFQVGQWIQNLTNSTALVYDTPRLALETIVRMQSTKLTLAEKRQMLDRLEIELKPLSSLRPSKETIETTAIELYSELTGQSRNAIRAAYLDWSQSRTPKKEYRRSSSQVSSPEDSVESGAKND